MSRAGAVVVAVAVTCLAVGVAMNLGAPAEPGPAVAPNGLAAAMRRAHFAFHPREATWLAGGDGLAIRADRGGFAVEPDGRAPVAFGWGELERGGRALADRLQLGQDVDGALRVDRGAFVEHLRSGPSGLEQSWSFATSPSGAGALRVGVTVNGAAFAAATGTGLHFAGLRYGHATWVDAAGQKTEVAARWTGSHIELEVPGALLEASRYPAVLDPIIGPESAVDVPVGGAPASGTQARPRIAYGAGVFLSVWEDTRSGSIDIFGARVTAGGIVLDPVGIPISMGPENETEPGVAFDGTSFLAVWEDFRNSSTVNLWAARVSPQGQVLDPAGFFVASCGRNVSVTSSGTGFYVAYARGISCGSAPEAIHGATVSADAGSVREVVLVSQAPSSSEDPAVAFDGTRYLVAYAVRASDGGRLIQAIRVETDGGRLDPAPLHLAGATSDRREPAAAPHPGGWLVAWLDRDAGNYDILASRVSSAGAVLDPAGIVVTNDPANQSEISLAPVGAETLVTWNGTASGWGARVDATGAVLDVGGVQLSPEGPVEAASNSTLLFLTWNERGDVRGARFTPGLAPIDASSLLLSTSSNEQQNATAAFNGSAYLVVWADRRSDAYDVFGRRFDVAGAPIDAVSFPICDAPGAQVSPQVASDGTGFLVIWTDARDGGAPDIRGAPVSAGGLVGAELVVSAAAGSQSGPALVYGAGHYLATWSDTRDGGARAVDVYGSLITPAGAVLQPGGFVVTGATNEQLYPALAWNGSRFLATWTDFRSTTAIYAARISVDAGTPVVQDPAGRLVVSSAAAFPSAVSSDGTRFLVAWDQLVGGGYDVLGARVADDGTVLDTGAAVIPIGTSTSTTTHHQRAALAFDGTNYVAAWTLTTGGVFQPVRVNLRGARIKPDGGVLDPSGGVVVSTDPFKHQAPRVTAGASKRVLAAYTRFDPDAGVLSQRALLRTLVFNEAPVTDGGAFSTAEDTPRSITFAGSDFDEDALTFVVLAGPDAGTLSGSGATRTWSPAADFFGSDAVTYEVIDPAGASSGPARVTLTVTAVNDAPIALSQSVTTPQDTAAGIALQATDVDSPSLALFVRYGPDAGALSGTPPSVIYTPGVGFTGNDAFAFVANDGLVDSAPAIVSIVVTAVDAGPVDGGAVDAGTVDGGAVDAGTVDAGAVDAGAVDAGAVDAGAVDAGAVDAGAVDAGTVDAGTVDAGEADAGEVDAGAGGGAGGGGGAAGGAAGGGATGGGVAGGGGAGGGSATGGGAAGGGGAEQLVGGCGCGASPVETMWLLGLLLLVRRTSRRSRG